MPLPSSINDLSQTAGSNSPSGSEAPSLIDDYLRTYASYIAQHRDGKGFALEASVASAATCDIGAANSLIVQITGTTGITSFGTTYSGPRIVRFAAALTLTHSASLVLPGAANITTAAGDFLIAVPNGNPGSGYRVVAYHRANGQALYSVTDLATATGVLAVANGGTGQTTAPGVQSILPINQTRVDVASAATVNLTTGAASTDHINITGTTTITSFTVAAGRLLFVRFAGSLTLTNGAGLVTQTGGNIITQAGDTCILRATAANVVEVLAYVPAILNQQTTRSMVRVQGSNGYGSTNTGVRRWTSVITNVGSDITYADSATLGGTFTINTAGVYGISYTDAFGAAGDMCITLNATVLTGIPSTFSEVLFEATTAAAGTRACAAGTAFLAAGSVIRAQSGFGASGARQQFTITRVA